MRSIFDEFREPIFIDWYVDQQGNKVSIQRQNEQHKIINNHIVIAELMDEFYKVQIDGMIEIPWESEITHVNEFACNYTLGLIKFHSNRESQTINIKSYYSRGIVMYHVSRIFIDVDNNEVVKTLKDLIDSGENALDGLERLEKIIQDAEDAINNANTSATYAENKGDYAQQQGDYAQQQGDFAKEQGEFAQVATSNVNDKIAEVENRMSDIEIEYNSTLKPDIQSATSDAIMATDNATQSATYADNKANYAQSMGTYAKDQGDYALEKGDYANTQGTYAKDQGDYALEKGDYAEQVIQNLGHKDEYDNATLYKPNNVVSYNGSSYMCVQEVQGIPPTDTMYWKLVGEKGEDAVGLIFKGTWNDSTNYLENTLVSYDGRLYACIQDNTGIPPTDDDYWEIFLDNINIQFKTQTFNTTEGQVIFNITNGEYRVNQNMIDVYVRGVKQPKSAYIEASKTQIVFKDPLPANMFVEMKYIESLSAGITGNYYHVGVLPPENTGLLWIDIS